MAGYHKSDVPGLFWLDRAKRKRQEKDKLEKLLLFRLPCIHVFNWLFEMRTLNIF